MCERSDLATIGILISSRSLSQTCESAVVKIASEFWLEIWQPAHQASRTVHAPRKWKLKCIFERASAASDRCIIDLMDFLQKKSPCWLTSRVASFQVRRQQDSLPSSPPSLSRTLLCSHHHHHFQARFLRKHRQCIQTRSFRLQQARLR